MSTITVFDFFLVFVPMMVCFFLAVPVSYSIGAATVLYIMLSGHGSLMIMPQRIYAAIDSFVYIAIPLFIFAGYMMETGGISKRLFDWVKSVFWWIPGGSGTITLLCCAVFAALTGSVIATCVAMTSLAFNTLLEDGYTPAKASGLIACGGTLGPVIPPSIAMIIYGASMNVSIPQMFIASIIPGLILLTSMVAVNIMYVKKARLKVDVSTSSWKEIAIYTLRSLGALLLPVIILGGIYGGVFTAAEAGCIASVYCVLLTLAYRQLTWEKFIRAARNTVKTTAAIMLIVGMANGFTWILSFTKIPGYLVKLAIPLLGGNWILYMVALMIILFIAGALIETTASILILGPILIPIGEAMGLNSLFLGVAFCVCLCVGYATPPFGMALFTVSSASHVPYGKVVNGAWPFLIAMAIAMFVIALYPPIIMFLPNLLQ